MKSFTVSTDSGRIAFMGYGTGSEIFVCYNDNYGMGDWTFISQYMISQVDAPDTDVDLSFEIFKSDNLNAIFIDNSNKIIFSGNQLLGNQDEYIYYYLKSFPYIFEFDFNSLEFSFQVQAPKINENAANPNYVWQKNEIYLPWDTDNDGVIDEFNDDGTAFSFDDWPVSYYDLFSENTMKVCSNNENGWIVNIWLNSLKCKYYMENGNEEFADWEDVVEIYITISNDNGEHWSEPIIMNAKLDDIHYQEELTDLHPAFIYPGDIVEDMGDNWGLLHLMFLDDYDYETSEDGGMMKYASIKIDFGYTLDAEEELVVSDDNNLYNYPNPFNLSATGRCAPTNISFNLAKKSAVELTIFNVKGQKIKTLLNENLTTGEHTIVWNGMNEEDRSASSGVYFYKLKTDSNEVVKRMILLK